jgi:predicted TIM-barrel enzyme
MNNNFYSFKQLFTAQKTVIGMIHLSGSGAEDRVRRARQELDIFAEEGVHGAIIENYHGDISNVKDTLDSLGDTQLPLALGINLVGGRRIDTQWFDKYPFLKFSQMDNVRDPNISDYERFRDFQSGDLVFIGGVQFKYQPSSGLSLEEDIKYAIKRVDAICTTGDATGNETPIEKLRAFRNLMGDYPLIVGAGVNLQNVREQLSVADAAIVGSYFKNGNTESLIDRQKVRDLIAVVKDI